MRGDLDADSGGPGLVQGHPVPGERDGGLPHPLAVRPAVVEESGLQGGVEERRVHPEARRAGRRVVGGVGGQDDLREEVLAPPPGRPQSLEDGTVGEALFHQTLVETVHGEGRGVLRGPLRQVVAVAIAV